MKKLGVTTLVAGGLVAGLVGLAAPAEAAPRGGGSSQDTISQLEAPSSGTPRAGDDTVKRITTRTAYVVVN